MYKTTSSARLQSILLGEAYKSRVTKKKSVEKSLFFIFARQTSPKKKGLLVV